MPTQQELGWICPGCYWYDGSITCLKSDEYNFDGSGIKGVFTCQGFLKIQRSVKNDYQFQRTNPRRN